MAPQPASPHLFAYGTLLFREILQKVTNQTFSSTLALLPNHARRRITGAGYPALIEKPGETVQGRLYWNLPHTAWGALDQFEGEMYTRHLVWTQWGEDETAQAQTYLLKPAFHFRLREQDWDEEAFFQGPKKQFMENPDIWE